MSRYMLSIVYAPGAVQPDEAALETIGADVQAVTRRMQDAGCGCSRPACNPPTPPPW